MNALLLPGEMMAHIIADPIAAIVQGGNASLPSQMCYRA